MSAWHTARMSAGWPLVRLGRPPAIHKKLQSPQSHISQAIHYSPCLTDPHTPRIPIQVMFPYVPTDPPYRHQAPKIPTLVSTRPASGAADSQPILPDRFPEPASHLRKSIPNRLQQITHACDWGGGAVTSCTYGHGHIHSRVCARPWSRAHIHGHAHGHGASQPDETSVRFTQIKRQSNSLKRPAAA